MDPYSPRPHRAQAPRLARHDVVDYQHDGMVVSGFEHPGEWRARSQVVWNMQHIDLPVQAEDANSFMEGNRVDAERVRPDL